MVHYREPLPVLTSLRFFAAVFVLVAHAIVRLPDILTGPAGPIAILVSGLAGEGMTLFFVLSGFVIHYNYSQSLTSGAPQAYWSFFVARFSRLVPLYLAVMLFALWDWKYLARIDAGSAAAVHVAQSLPYYLTLTHSWFFMVLGNSSLIYQIPHFSGLSWSVSTEWFFYLAFPAILLLVRPHDPRGLLWIALVSMVVIWTAMAAIELNARAIDRWAVSVFGPVADGVPVQDSFRRWLLYFSPYSRVFEFFVGVVTSAMFLKLGGRNSVTANEQRLGGLLLWASIASIAAMHFLFYGPIKTGLPTIVRLDYNGGLTIPIAILIFSLCRYNTKVSRLLSWAPLQWGGEVSYSIYLVHILVMTKLLWIIPTTFDPQRPLTGAIWIAAAVVVTIAVSAVTFALIEWPSRWGLRKLLIPKRQPASPLGELAGPPTSWRDRDSLP